MNFEQMKSFMNSLTSWRIPGNSISVCLEGKEVFNYQSGYSDLENKIPMTESGLFNIYSCSKVLTVCAALQLYEKGLFLLDDPLYDFIPEYRTMYVKNKKEEYKAKNPITLRHLFTMTSGINYNCNNQSIENARKITNGKMNTLEVIRHLANEPICFEPGEYWQYGLSHDILAAVVEVVSGAKFSDYVKENILNPLSMNETYYHNEEIIDKVHNQYQFVNSAEEDIVKLQTTENSKGGEILLTNKSVNLILGVEYDSGGAGITTSVSDYSKFCNTLSLGGTSPKGERILSEETIRLLKTNQLNKKQLSTYNWPQLKGYGYGLGVRTLTDIAESGYNGNTGEFGWGGAAGATVLVDTELKLSMFYTHHMLNPQEAYYQPRLRNVLYSCIKS